MRRQHAAIFVLVVISFLLGLPVFAQEDMVVVAGDSFEDQRRPAAVFREGARRRITAEETCGNIGHALAHQLLVHVQSLAALASDLPGNGDGLYQTQGTSLPS